MVWVAPSMAASWMFIPWASRTEKRPSMVSSWVGIRAASQYLSVMPNQPPVDWFSIRGFLAQSLYLTCSVE